MTSAAEDRSNRALFVRNWRVLFPQEEPGVLLVLIQATSRFETQYASPAAWTINVPAMATSNNYGAITCRGPESPTCIGGVRDSNQAGEPYTTFFKAYPTADDGVQDLIRRLTRPEIRAAGEAGNVLDYVRAMYASHYFAGVCSVATQRYGAQAARESTFSTGKPAETAGGRACDDEVVTNYAAKIKLNADAITAALGMEPIPLESFGARAWPVLGVLALIAAAGAAWWFLRDEDAEPLPKLPLRRNAPRSAWRELYRTTCGEERDERRDDARQLGAARRLEVGDDVKRDRSTLTKARRTEIAAARKQEALRARIEAKRAKLKAELAELGADADRPCEEARAELHRATERDKRERSERRSPKQRAASRRQLEHVRERIEQEADDLEHQVADDFDAMLGARARRWFIANAARFLRESRQTGGRTRPAELAYDRFAEDVENQRAAAVKDDELTDAELDASEAAHWEELEQREEARRWVAMDEAS